MKKVLFLMLAVLLVAGAVYAASIPQSEDPKAGPGVWMIPIFNNEASSTMAVGSVVVWDIGSSDGDNDNYVVGTTTADTHIVAGVIWPNAVPAQSRGTIAIKGVVDCDIDAGGVQAGGLACTSGATEFEGRTCQDDTQAYAQVINTTAATTGKCMVFLK